LDGRTLFHLQVAKVGHNAKRVEKNIRKQSPSVNKDRIHRASIVLRPLDMRKVGGGGKEARVASLSLSLSLSPSPSPSPSPSLWNLIFVSSIMGES
jgi:hypothetical protein